MDWPAAILDSQCRWTLGESLTHSQSDDRRGLNLDIEGLVSNKMHRLCRRDLEGALPLYNCHYDERTEESKHWHPVDWESIERKTEISPEMTLRGHRPKVDIIRMITTTMGE